MVITNLLANMVVLTIHGAIPTNTPAIRSYAFQTLFANAQAAAHAWHLDESLVSSNKVTEFEIEPYPSGINGWIIFEQRYSFGTARGSSVGFTDRLYYEHMIGYDTNHAATLDAWIHATNRLTLKEAQQLAESAMRAVGVRPQTLGRPREKTQLTIWRPTGPPAPLPYYKFRWEKGNSTCDIHVSGITSNIVHFSCSGCLQPAALTNYLELLGLRSDTVFVRRRATSPPTYELWWSQ